jgi:hypothetical protein
MGHQAAKEDFLQQLYATEETLGGLFGHFGFSFSPVLLSGDVSDPGIYNLPVLAPTTTQEATYTAAGASVTDTYTGIKLWDLLSDAGGATVTSAKNDILSKYVVATGSDGYKAVFSLGEIDPSFGAQPIMVAYADTGGQLGPQGSDGLARMVVPGDQAGGRYVSDLVKLDVKSLREPGPSGPGGISDQLALSGDIADPSIVTPATLAAPPSVNDGNRDLYFRRRTSDRYLHGSFAVEPDPGRGTSDRPVDQERSVALRGGRHRQ